MFGHEVEKARQGDAGQLGSLAEAEAALANLFQKPQEAQLPGEMVGLPGMMGESVGGEIHLEPAGLDRLGTHREAL